MTQHHPATRLLTVVVAVCVVTSMVAAPVSAQILGSDDSETDQQPDIIRYGSDSTPSVVVTYDNGSYGDLTDWANASSVRSLEAVDHETRTAVVAAPQWDIFGIGTSLARIPTSAESVVAYATDGDRLAGLEWVESVGLNYRLSIPDQPDTLNASDYSPPEKWAGLSSYDVPSDGLAFSDEANRTTMQESRAALGRDNTTASSDGYSRPYAVIDTGTNLANGQVFGNGTAGSALRIENASKNFITNETYKQNGSSAIADGNGHGTWVSAASAANTTADVHDGVAPDADLLVLKALADDGSGSTANIAQSIRYAADHNASVISMSLGSPVYSEALADAVAYAQEQGSVVVVAVGNSRQTTRWVASPADVDGVIGVGAVTGDEPASAESAYFSQIGPDPGTTDDSGLESAGAAVDVAAPGFKTVARVPTSGGATTNETLSGTSMATPMVAAGVYLTRAQHTDWGVSKTRSVAETATRPIPKAGVTEVGRGEFAVDYSVNETEGDSQEDARTDGAITRDVTYRSMRPGGRFTDFLGQSARVVTTVIQHE